MEIRFDGRDRLSDDGKTLSVYGRRIEDTYRAGFDVELNLISDFDEDGIRGSRRKNSPVNDRTDFPLAKEMPVPKRIIYAMQIYFYVQFSGSDTFDDVFPRLSRIVKL